MPLMIISSKLKPKMESHNGGRLLLKQEVAISQPWIKIYRRNLVYTVYFDLFIGDVTKSETGRRFAMAWPPS